jgi:ATP/maltotriose-dependent transcriptional regulator MalT
VLAAAGRLEEAESALQELRSSPTVESIVLRGAVELVIEIKRGGRLHPKRLATLEDRAFETGALDLLVTAYRAVPELLVLLFRSGRPSDRVVDLVRRVGDDDLVQTLGLSVADDDRRQLLTRREREVFDLLRQGLSNRQIADVLVVSESTAKLHVQHVFNKVGIHSRQALAIQAALERSNQATAAEGGVSSSGS